MKRALPPRDVWPKDMDDSVRKYVEDLLDALGADDVEAWADIDETSSAAEIGAAMKAAYTSANKGKTG